MNNNEGIRQRLLNAKQAAKYLGITPKTLWKWVNAGIVKQVKLNGRKPKYDIRDLDYLIDKNKNYSQAAIAFNKVIEI